MATSPLAWQFTWMPARCTRSTHAFSVVLRLGDVALVGRRHARIRRAQRHGALRERAVHGVLGGGAELDPLVAESGLDAGRDHRLQRAAARFVADPVPAARRARARPASPAGCRPGGARWSGRSARTASRCAPRRHARAVRAAPAVNVGRVPTLLNAAEARSVTRPVSSPFSSRSNVPPVGLGVSFVMPAISNALLL